MRYKLHQDEGEIRFRRAPGSLDIGMIYTGKRQAQTKGKVEKIFDYLQGGYIDVNGKAGNSAEGLFSIPAGIFSSLPHYL